MKIKDFVYGNFNIEEQVLIKLINSKAIQRLNGISQCGLPKEFSSLPIFTRYDHSIGVMLLLRKLGASIEEQIAGLLHDVSHTAFSHTADWVFDSAEEENFQDKNHENLILNSDVPKILEKYNFNISKIIKIHDFQLLERKAPDLCADRVDYTLRELQTWVDPKIVSLCLNSLIIYKNEIIFNSNESAKVFGLGYVKCNALSWSGIEPSIRVYLLAKALKIAFRNNILSLEDFYEDDLHLLNLLRKSKNNEIQKLLLKLSEKIKFKIVEQNPEISMKKKFRWVDPKYLENDKIYVLSEVDKEYKSTLEEQRRINKKGININLII